MSDDTEKAQLGNRVRKARAARGWSQEDLAEKTNTSQSTVGRIETGDWKRKPSELSTILTMLEIDKGTVPSGKTRPTGFDRTDNHAFTTARNSLVGERNLPVFASAEAGSGALIVSSDPVEYVLRPAPLYEVVEGYGLIVVLESMVPEFRPGDTALVHPHLPPLAGEACVFYSDDGHGEVRAIIKSFVKSTATHWHVEQWNPAKKMQLDRKEWQKCHRIVGRYSRR